MDGALVAAWYGIIIITVITTTVAIVFWDRRDR
jgi:hypothetical protein